MKNLSKLSILAFYSSTLLVVIIFLKLTSIHFGNNPLNNNHKTKSQLTSLFPQGWAFFTKSSREPQFYIFDCNFSNPKLKNLRNFSSEYYFGMSRKSRILNIEINTIFQKIIEDSIKKTIVKTSEINLVPKELRGKIHYQKIMINKDIIPSFKGKYLFVSQTMLPWNILKRKSDYPSSFTVYPIEIYQK